MRRSAARTLLLALVLALPGATVARAECATEGLPEGRTVVELQTTAGELCIEMLDGQDEAPGHVENFLYYVESGDYVGTFFHRFVPDFVMQGGQWFVGPPETGVIEPREGVIVENEPCEIDAWSEGSDPAEDPPDICSTRGNEQYTIALAKLGGDPDSGTVGWFINLEDNRPNLDQQNGGFTVFGRLIHPQSIETVERMIASGFADSEDFFWADAGFGYDSATIDGQEIVLPTFTDIPILVPGPWDSDAFGCLDMREQATIVFDDDLPNVTLDPSDPDSPAPVHWTVSAACGTPIELPDFEPGSGGTTGCPDPDRVGMRSRTPAPITAPGETPAPAIVFPVEYLTFTCEQLRESDTQRAAWRDEFFRAFREDMTITINAATVHTVEAAQPAPEPVNGFVWGLAGLAALARRRRLS